MTIVTDLALRAARCAVESDNKLSADPAEASALMHEATYTRQRLQDHIAGLLAENFPHLSDTDRHSRALRETGEAMVQAYRAAREAGGPV